MAKNIFVLGVTGVIGSGKSVFCKFLQKFFGFHYIDADSIVRNLYLAGNDGYKRITAYFGGDFVNRTDVNRDRLRKFILMYPEKRAKYILRAFFTITSYEFVSAHWFFSFYLDCF